MAENEKKDESKKKRRSIREMAEESRKRQLAEKGLPDMSFKELAEKAESQYFRLFRERIGAGIAGFIILALIIITVVFPKFVIHSMLAFLATAKSFPASVNHILNQPIGANYLLIILIAVTAIGYFTSFLSIGLGDPSLLSILGLIQ